MNTFIKFIIFVAAICTLFACEKAVREPENVSFIILGDSHSALYPIEVKQHSEDVFIKMKESAPIPEISSSDGNGNEEVFLFNVEQDRLIIPGKFDRLCLRHTGEKTIEIVRGNIQIGLACK